METLYKSIWGNAGMQQGKEQKKALQQVIESLPEDQQQVIHLHYLKQLSVKSIAEQYKCSVTTIYTKLHRALFKLRNELNPDAYKRMYEILYPLTGKPGSLP